MVMSSTQQRGHYGRRSEPPADLTTLRVALVRAWRSGRLDEAVYVAAQKELAAADPDKDGTLSKDEYLAVVEKRFKAADPDNDGSVSAAEFKTGAGRSLGQLLS